MFRFFRYFSLVSLLALVGALVALVLLYRSMAMSQLVQMAETRNVTIAHSIGRVLWPRFGDYLSEVSSSNYKALPTHSETTQIGVALEGIVLEPPVLRCRLYNREGITIFSTHAREIGEDKSQIPGFVAARREASTTSTLQERGGMLLLLNDLLYAGRVVSHVPLQADDGSIGAVVEIVSDVSPWLAGVYRTQYLLVGALLAVFGIFFGLMFWLVRRADQMLMRQQEKIRRQEASYQALEQKLEGQTQKRLRFERALRYSRQLKLSMPPQEPRHNTEEPPRQQKAQVLQFPKIQKRPSVAP